ncbi:MAG: PD40 domain-containing protein [Candidatus Aminicenantes bacterium]|nr:MAG: PD40 domain-containing protein [Candidatus Aminicenantes bacterium]
MNFSFKKVLYVFCLILSFSIFFIRIDADTVKWKVWGQSPPDLKPIPFASKIIPANFSLHSCLSFSPDERTILWAVLDRSSSGSIVFSRFNGEVLSKPEVLSFLEHHNYGNPFYSFDGRKIYFTSNQPLPGEKEAPYRRIWVVEKDDSNWSKPKPLKGKIHSIGVSSQISVSRCGNIYFAAYGPDNLGIDIYVSKLIKDAYMEPTRLQGEINTEFVETDPFIDPEERFIIFSSSRKENYGPSDLYLSYKQSNEEWSDAIHLKNSINTKLYERFPYITRDGKYLFFVRNDNPLQFRGSRKQFFWVNFDTTRMEVIPDNKIPENKVVKRKKK